MMRMVWEIQRDRVKHEGRLRTAARFGLTIMFLLSAVPLGSAVERYTRDNPALVPSVPQYDIEGIDNLVPEQVILEMVHLRADERWPTYAVGTPIPAVNLEGKLVCYHVPVVIGETEFPEILSAPTASELGQTNLRDHALWGIPRFWRFTVSARYSDFPVFHHGQGLPHLLVTYHAAAERARELLDTTEVQLRHYISLGQPGTFYRFACPDGRTALIHAARLTGHIEKEPATRGTAATRDDDPAAGEGDAQFRQEVRDAWQEAIDRLPNEEQ